MNNQAQNLGTQVKNVGKKKRTNFTQYEIKCVKCSVEYKSRNKKSKFCSHKCYSENKKGEKHNWGSKIGDALRGVPKSKKHIEAVARAYKEYVKKHGSPNPRAEKHWKWKGDEVGYDALHDWVARHKGRPKKCESCGESSLDKTYHWANKSGRYLRNLDDWSRLCVPCHSKLDKSRPYSYKGK